MSLKRQRVESIISSSSSCSRTRSKRNALITTTTTIPKEVRLFLLPLLLLLVSFDGITTMVLPNKTITSIIIRRLRNVVVTSSEQYRRCKNSKYYTRTMLFAEAWTTTTINARQQRSWRLLPQQPPIQQSSFSAQPLLLLLPSRDGRNQLVHTRLYSSSSSSSNSATKMEENNINNWQDTLSEAASAAVASPKNNNNNNDNNNNNTPRNVSIDKNLSSSPDPSDETHPSDINKNDVRTSSIMDPQELLRVWKTLPIVNPILTFDTTLLVPSSSIQTYVQHPSLQSLLAKPSNWDMLQNVHPRIKMVQEYNNHNHNYNHNNDDDDDDGATSTTSTTKTTTYKQLLLLPSHLWNDDDDAVAALETLLREKNGGDNIIQRGPPCSIQLSYSQLSFPYILQQLLPPHLLPPPSAYEQIGHIAHFNLKDDYAPYQHLIGQVLVATTPGIETVVQKVGQVSGKYRTYDYVVLADTRRRQGTNNSTLSSLETTVMEDGVQVQLNVAECYWCTRLSGERQALIQDIMRTSSLSTTQSLVVADVFCGVGAVCLLLAKKRQQQQEQQQQLLGEVQKNGQSSNNTKNTNSRKGTKKRDNDIAVTTEQVAKSDVDDSPTVTAATTRIIANDWNPKAIEYFERSIRANNLDSATAATAAATTQFDLSCVEAYDFLVDLGAEQEMVTDEDNSKANSPAAATSTATAVLPDHVLMNFPLEAPKFLGALRWWPWEQIQQKYDDAVTAAKESGGSSSSDSSSSYPRFHVYTFARATTVGADDEEEVAVDIIANELLPPIFSSRNNYGGGAFEDGNRSDGKIEDDDTATSSLLLHRRQELNEEFDANVSTRMVRDVAPGKVVVCVSFSLTPKLIRYMQGEYF